MPFVGEDRRIYTNYYRSKRRQEALMFLGGKCVDCDTTEALDFDHVDPATKLARISKLWTASKDRFWAEVRKCELRCYMCHNKRTRRLGHISRRSWCNR